MKRYIITEQQLTTIVGGEVSQNKQILDEGVKDVIFGVLMATMSISSAFGQTDKDKIVLNKVKDPMVQQKVAKMLVQKGDKSYEEALEFVKDNAENYEDEYRRKFGSLNKRLKVDFTDEKDYKRFLAKLKDGYSVTKIEADTVAKKLQGEEDPSSKITSVNSMFNSDEAFETASYELKESTKGSINSLLDSLKNNGYIIMGAEVESSTDKEPISMGNEQLAKLRAQSVAKVLVEKGIDSSIVSIETNPEQGPDVYSRTMSDEERAEARKQTAKFRYVRVNLALVKLQEAPPTDVDVDEPADVIVYSIVVSKPIKNSKGKMRHGKVYKGSCKKLKCPNPFKSFNTPSGSVLGN